MIQTEQNTHTVEGTLSGKRVRMGVDEAAMGHVMSVLTNMYSDNILAVIREYSTNARDSHVEAGNPSPIEVQLPGSLYPVLSIRDYGVGLDAEGIETIYSRYGTSTKRDTNAQTGMLGIGCKSALAYADQFTLVGIKDGRRVQVAISRTARGGGDMTIVSDEPTDASNGVEVLIPVNPGDAAEFQKTAGTFFAHWPRGSVTVNGQEPTPFIEGAMKVTDEIYLKVDDAGYHYTNEALIVMGGIAYPVRDGIGQPYGLRAIAHVPIGAVAFAPSREALDLNDPATKATLSRLRNAYEANIAAALTRLLDSAPDKPSARKLRDEYCSKLGRQSRDATYKGQVIPEQLTVPRSNCKTHTDDANVSWKCADCSNTLPMLGYRRLNDALKDLHEGWHMRIMDVSTILVEDYEGGNFTDTRGRKLKQWAEEQGLRRDSQVVFTRPGMKLANLEWVAADQITRVSWDTIWAVKLPRKQTTKSGRPAGVFKVWEYESATGCRGWSSVHPDDFKANALYVRAATSSGHTHASYNPDTPIIEVPDNRLAKFKRDNPKIKDAVEVRAKLRASCLKTLSKEQRLAVFCAGAAPYHQRADGLRGLKADKIDDPELAAMIRAISGDHRAVITTCRELNVGFDTAPDGYIRWREAYPLIAQNHPEHSTLYINAVYAAANTTQGV